MAVICGKSFLRCADFDAAPPFFGQDGINSSREYLSPQADASADSSIELRTYRTANPLLHFVRS